MTLDASIKGVTDETMTIRVDPARLRAFAEAIGENRDLYRDAQAARAAGYPGIPAPPTFHFSLGLERSRPLGMLEDRGVELLRVLHGEQRFRYENLAFAGDTLAVSRRVSDYFEKKDGALKFIVIETNIRKDDGTAVSSGYETLVLPDRAPAGKSQQKGSPPALDAEGEALPTLRPGIVIREMLMRFGPASGDFNRVHLDRDAARSAGYDDVFAQGMLSMAWLGRLLTDRFPQERIRDFSVRFLSLMPLAAEPVCEGCLRDGGKSADLRVRLADGTLTLTGNAWLSG